MSTGMLLMLLVWGFVALVSLVCGLTIHYSDDLQLWGRNALRPWLKRHGLL